MGASLTVMHVLGGDECLTSGVAQNATDMLMIVLILVFILVFVFMRIIATRRRARAARRVQEDRVVGQREWEGSLRRGFIQVRDELTLVP